MVKNQQTRLRLIKYLVAEKIPEYNLNSVNTLAYDPVTGKEGKMVIYGVEFWADLPPSCDMDVFEMITNKFGKKILFCYSRKIQHHKIDENSMKKNIAEMEFSDAWGEEGEETAKVNNEEIELGESDSSVDDEEEDEDEDEDDEDDEDEDDDNNGIPEPEPIVVNELAALNELEDRALQDKSEPDQIEEPQM